MQASRASAAPREQAARILKNGRQAAHSADTLRRKQIPADKQKMNQAQSLAVLRPIHI